MFRFWKSTPIWVVAMLYLFVSINAQDNKIKLTLAEALENTRANNFDINMAEAEVEAMQADLNKSLAVFLPQLIISETFVKTNDPLMVFGLKLKQQSVTMEDFNPALLNNPDPMENFNTSFQIMQPLINFDGFYGRAAAANGVKAMTHKKKRVENYMKFMVKLNYYQLSLMDKSLAVVEEALETAKANRKLISDYFNEGLITKADYLMSEVFVSKLESQRAEVESRLINTSGNLKHLMGIEDSRTIETTDSLAYYEVEKAEPSIEFIVNNRSDLQSYKYRVESMGNMKSAAWMKFLPRLNAFGRYEFNGKNAFGSDSKNWLVGLNLNWNVFSGYRNIGALQKSEAELRHAEIEFSKAKSQASNEIKEALLDLETAKKKLSLAKTTVVQSKESLRIIKDRFSKGLEKTTDLLNAETSTSGSRLEYLKTLFFYNVSIFKVELMTEEKIENKI